MDGRTEEKRTAAAEPGARSDIAEARKNIDRIDREMAELFAERMQAAAVVAAYKEEHGLPVEDKAREAEMIARNTERLPPAYRPYYRNFLVGTITESKRYQRLLVSGLRVAYSGVEGAFAHIRRARRKSRLPRFRHGVPERGERRVPLRRPADREQLCGRRRAGYGSCVARIPDHQRDL